MESGKEMERSLPPQVEGDIQSTLIITIDEILWTNAQSQSTATNANQTDSVVSFLWWGDETPCNFYPVNIKNRVVESDIEKTKLIFHVRTSASLFSDYLKSSSPLVLTISSVANGFVFGTTIIEDCSTVMNTSKYHPILNNCVFIGDLKIHWELIPNQVLFYRDLKLNHQMLHIQPNAVKEAGTNAKEHDILEDVVQRGQSLRTAMLMSTLDFESEPRPVNPSEPRVRDPLIRKLLENPRAPDSLLHKYLLGEELTDLESVEQEQPASHHPDDQIKQHSSPQENNAPAESNTAPPQPNISPESEDSLQLILPRAPPQFDSLSITLETARLTRAGLRKIKHGESTVPRINYYAHVSCSSNKGVTLVDSQPGRVTTCTVRDQNILFNTSYLFSLPRVHSGAHSLKHITIKLFYQDKVPVLLGSIEPLPDVNSDHGPQWRLDQPLYSNNRLHVGFITLRFELESKENLVGERSQAKSSPKKCLPSSQQSKPNKPSRTPNVAAKSKTKIKPGSGNAKDNSREMERDGGTRGKERVEVDANVPTEKELDDVANIIKENREHIASTLLLQDNTPSASNRVSILNNYEFSISVPYISGLADGSYIEYSFPECLTKPDGKVTHDKLVYTLELGGCRNLHLISLPLDIPLPQYLSDIPSTGIMFHLYTGRHLTAQSYLLYGQLLAMYYENKSKQVYYLPTRVVHSESVQLLTLPMTLEYRYFQSTPQESADISHFWRRTCMLNKQFNTEQLARALDFECDQVPSRQHEMRSDGLRSDGRSQDLRNDGLRSQNLRNNGLRSDGLRSQNSGNNGLRSEDLRNNVEDLRNNVEDLGNNVEDLRNIGPRSQDLGHIGLRSEHLRNNGLGRSYNPKNAYDIPRPYNGLSKKSYENPTFYDDLSNGPYVNPRLYDEVSKNPYHNPTPYDELSKNPYHNPTTYDELSKNPYKNPTTYDELSKNPYKNPTTYDELSKNPYKNPTTYDKLPNELCGNPRPYKEFDPYNLPPGKARPHDNARYREGIDMYRTWQTVPEHMCEKLAMTQDVFEKLATSQPPNIENRATSQEPYIFENRATSQQPDIFEKRAMSQQPDFFEKQAMAEIQDMSENRATSQQPGIFENQAICDTTHGWPPQFPNEAHQLATEAQRRFIKERREAMRTNVHAQVLPHSGDEKTGSAHLRDGDASKILSHSGDQKGSAHLRDCDASKVLPHSGGQNTVHLSDYRGKADRSDWVSPTDEQSAQKNPAEIEPTGENPFRAELNDLDHRPLSAKLGFSVGPNTRPLKNVNSVSASKKAVDNKPHSKQKDTKSMRPAVKVVPASERLLDNKSHSQQKDVKHPVKPVPKDISSKKSNSKPLEQRQPMDLPTYNLNETVRFPRDYKYRRDHRTPALSLHPGAGNNLTGERLSGPPKERDSEAILNLTEERVCGPLKGREFVDPLCHGEPIAQSGKGPKGMASRGQGVPEKQRPSHGDPLKKVHVHKNPFYVVKEELDGQRDPTYMPQDGLGHKDPTSRPHNGASHGDPMSALQHGLKGHKDPTSLPQNGAGHGDPMSAPQEAFDGPTSEQLPSGSDLKKYFCTSKEEYERLLDNHRKYRFWKYLENQERIKQEEEDSGRTKLCKICRLEHKKQGGQTTMLCNLCTVQQCSVRDRNGCKLNIRGDSGCKQENSVAKEEYNSYGSKQDRNGAKREYYNQENNGTKQEYSYNQDRNGAEQEITQQNNGSKHQESNSSKQKNEFKYQENNETKQNYNKQNNTSGGQKGADYTCRVSIQNSLDKCESWNNTRHGKNERISTKNTGIKENFRRNIENDTRYGESERNINKNIGIKENNSRNIGAQEDMNGQSANESVKGTENNEMRYNEVVNKEIKHMNEAVKKETQNKIGNMEQIHVDVDRTRFINEAKWRRELEEMKRGLDTDARTSTALGYRDDGNFKQYTNDGAHFKQNTDIDKTHFKHNSNNESNAKQFTNIESTDFKQFTNINDSTFKQYTNVNNTTSLQYVKERSTESPPSLQYIKERSTTTEYPKVGPKTPQYRDESPSNLQYQNENPTIPHYRSQSPTNLQYQNENPTIPQYRSQSPTNLQYQNENTTSLEHLDHSPTNSSELHRKLSTILETSSRDVSSEPDIEEMEIGEDGNEERTANEYRTEERRKDVEDVASRFDETRKQHYKYEVGYKNKPGYKNSYYRDKPIYTDTYEKQYKDNPNFEGENGYKNYSRYRDPPKDELNLKGEYKNPNESLRDFDFNGISDDSLQEYIRGISDETIKDLVKELNEARKDYKDISDENLGEYAKHMKDASTAEITEKFSQNNEVKSRDQNKASNSERYSISEPHHSKEYARDARATEASNRKEHGRCGQTTEAMNKEYPNYNRPNEAMKEYTSYNMRTTEDNKEYTNNHINKDIILDHTEHGLFVGTPNEKILSFEEILDEILKESEAYNEYQNTKDTISESRQVLDLEKNSHQVLGLENNYYQDNQALDVHTKKAHQGLDVDISHQLLNLENHPHQGLDISHPLSDLQNVHSHQVLSLDDSSHQVIDLEHYPHQELDLDNMNSHQSLPNTANSVNVDGQERDSTREENRNTISEINTSDELTCDHMNNISSEHRDYLPGESLSYETSLPQNTKGQQLSEPHLIKSSNRDKVDAIIADIMREDEASGPQELGGHRRTTIQGRNEQKSHKETAVQGIHKQGGHKRKMVQRSNEQAGRKRTIVEEMNEQTSHKITTVQRTNELAAHKRQTVERIKEQTLHKIGQRTNEQSHVETLDSTNLISDQATNQNQSIQTNPRDHISNQKPNQSVVDLTNSIYDAGYKGPLDQSIASASRGTNQSASQKDNYQNSNQTNRYANDSSVIDLTDDVCNEISQMEITNSIEVTQCSSQNKSDNRYGENSKHSNSCSNSQHYSNNYSNNSKHSNGCSNNIKHSSENYSNNSKDSSNNCSNDKHSSNICSNNSRDYSNTYSNNIQHSNNTYSNNSNTPVNQHSSKKEYSSNTYEQNKNVEASKENNSKPSFKTPDTTQRSKSETRSGRIQIKETYRLVKPKGTETNTINRLEQGITDLTIDDEVTANSNSNKRIHSESLGDKYPPNSSKAPSTTNKSPNNDYLNDELVPNSNTNERFSSDSKNDKDIPNSNTNRRTTKYGGKGNTSEQIDHSISEQEIPNKIIGRTTKSGTKATTNLNEHGTEHAKETVNEDESETYANRTYDLVSDDCSEDDVDISGHMEHDTIHMDERTFEENSQECSESNKGYENSTSEGFKGYTESRRSSNENNQDYHENNKGYGKSRLGPNETNQGYTGNSQDYHENSHKYNENNQNYNERSRSYERSKHNENNQGYNESGRSCEENRRYNENGQYNEINRAENSIVIVDEMKRNDFVLVKEEMSEIREELNETVGCDRSTYWKYNEMDNTLVKTIQQHVNQNEGDSFVQPTVGPSQLTTSLVHFNLYNTTHYGESLRNATLFTSIKIKQAQNLPLVSIDGRNVAPTSYVTIENVANDSQYVWMSPVVIKSVSPIYDVRLTTKIPTSLLYKEKEYLILVVWYKAKINEFTGRDPSSDHVLGFVKISLAPLLTGLPSIRGWHNIVNFSNKICGQLKVSVDPLERIEIEESIVMKLVPEPVSLSASCSLYDLK
ncbi:hypothetical protein M8J77_013753 [Diaphorina citri]|nr:hypothetical protein M8J77_013753 [Diaphorina citri]